MDDLNIWQRRLWNEQDRCPIAKIGYYVIQTLKYSEIVERVIPKYSSTRADSNFPLELQIEIH